MEYKVQLTRTAVKTIKEIEQSERRQVHDKIGELTEDPEKRGKPLVGELKGYRSIPTSGRYRIIYQVDKRKRVATILGAGIRKEGDKHDIYVLAKRLIKMGLA